MKRNIVILVGLGFLIQISFVHHVGKKIICLHEREGSKDG